MEIAGSSFKHISLATRYHKLLGHVSVSSLMQIHDSNSVAGVSIAPELFNDEFTCLKKFSEAQANVVQSDRRRGSYKGDV